MLSRAKEIVFEFRLNQPSAPALLSPINDHASRPAGIATAVIVGYEGIVWETERESSGHTTQCYKLIFTTNGGRLHRGSEHDRR